MARIVYPTEEEMKVLRKLGLTEKGGVVIIDPHIAKKLDKAITEKALRDYRFGTYPDLAVDVVASEDHYIFTFLK